MINVRRHRVWVLYQGTTLVVPLPGAKGKGFSRCLHLKIETNVSAELLAGAKALSWGADLRHD
jgi:hypothetical protein